MSPPRSSSALVAIAAVVSGSLAGCGAHAWPTAAGLADPEFARGGREIATIDVLPVDVQVWSGDGRDPQAIAEGFDALTGALLADELGKRGYAVGARIGWDGSYVAADGAARPAMTSDEVGRTAYALSSYGSAQAGRGERLLVPFLPYRLAEATGADATLYIGGWVFAGTQPRSRASKIARGVLIGVAVVLVAVVVIAAIKGSKGGGGGGGGRVGRVASGVGQAASSTARVAGRMIGVAGRAAVGVGRVALRGATAVVRSGQVAELVLETAEGAIRMTDALGHHETHVGVVAGRPDYHARPGAPRRGRSRMLLEMTLIDNATGLALWHARQELAADPARAGDVARAMRHMLASLPAR